MLQQYFACFFKQGVPLQLRSTGWRRKLWAKHQSSVTDGRLGGPRRAVVACWGGDGGRPGADLPRCRIPDPDGGPHNWKPEPVFNSSVAVKG